jgi:hypothetical protein
MAMAPRVDFLIAGVQKGGTTALFQYLAEAPDVALADPKEVHFFDDDGQDWAAANYAAYEAHFPPPDGRPRGEATPIYLYWKDGLERIAAYNPAMKLVILLRDPVQRAWSHWRMEYARGAETEPFAWCIREGRQRLFRADLWGYHREYSYVERGFYGEQLERAVALFGRERLLVVKSDELRSDPGPVLVDVRRFLGLGPGEPPRPREIHVGQDIEYPSQLTDEDVAFLRSLYANDDRRLKALTGLSFA